MIFTKKGAIKSAKEVCDLPILNCYKNGNHYTTIFSDGTRVREPIGFSKKLVYKIPENMDIKISDQCPVGCKYCHESSTPNGKIGDIMNLPFVDTLTPGTEMACLDGETIVYTPYGSKKIKDLNVGDEIFNATNGISKIKKITITDKPAFHTVLKHGIEITSSNDHPFMVDGSEVPVSELLGKEIDTLPVDDGDSTNVMIDMAKYIHARNPKFKSSRGGKIIGNDEIRLTNSGTHSKRYINFDVDMAYLYGWFVAEGSRSSLTMSSTEKTFADKLSGIWRDHTGLTSLITVKEGLNSLNLELKNRTFTKHLFFDELKVGCGARNKNLSYLYSIHNKDIIRASLLGLFMGDGCFRERKTKWGVMYEAHLKTSSWRLAYDVMYLLNRWFGVKASLCHGKNKSHRPISGRDLPLTDYYDVGIYNVESLKNVFPEVYANVSTPKNANIVGLKVMSISDKHQILPLYDITLDGDVHTFPINGYAVTHNCGGGSALSHPDLIPFLEKLKSKGVLVNLTVNQKELQIPRLGEKMKEILKKDLVHGVGVSLTDNTTFNDTVDEIFGDYPNLVVHTIAGILGKDDMKCIKGRKTLILGYKDLHGRRAGDFYDKEKETVEKNIKVLTWNLPYVRKITKLISFDCLAIKQLDPKGKLHISESDWNTLFQGDDYTAKTRTGKIQNSTMYVDAVTRTVARSSTQPLNERLPFTDEDIEALFKKSCSNYKPVTK